MSVLGRSFRFAVPFALSVFAGIVSATVVVAYYHHYMIRHPPGVRQPADVRRLIVTRALAPPGQVVAPVLSTQEIAALGDAMLEQVDIAGYTAGTDAMLEGGYNVTISRVTNSFFRVLGVRLLLGQLPAPNHHDVGSERVAIISYALWERAFDRKASVVGQRVILDGAPTVITGVAAAEFRGIDRIPVDIWIPARRGGRRDAEYGLHAVTRVPPSATDSSLQRLLHGSSRHIEGFRPTTFELRPLSVKGAGTLIDGVAMLAVWLGLGAAALSFANAILLSALRMRQNAAALRMRWALGAPTHALVKEDSLLPICLVAGATSIVIVLLPWMAFLLESLGISGEALVARPAYVTAAASGICTLSATLGVSGIGTACVARWRPPRVGRSLSRWLAGVSAAHVLVVSLAGTVAAPILVGTLNLMRIEPGFDASTAVIRVDMGDGPAPPEHALSDVLRRLQASPGVLAAAVASGLPLTATSIMSATHEPLLQGVPAHVITYIGDLVQALGIPLERGSPEWRDGLIISEAMAQRLGGVQAACLRLDPGRCEPVLGVAHDVSMVALGERPQPVVYRRAHPSGNPLFIVIRGAGPGGAPRREWQETLATAFPRASLHGFTMAARVRSQRAPASAIAIAALYLFGTAATIAVLGLAVTARTAVWLRRRELGIRSALGAPFLPLLWQALSGLLLPAMLAAVAGCLVGILTARPILMPAAGTWVIQIVVTCSIVFVVAVVSLIPAFRALHTAPRLLLGAGD